MATPLSLGRRVCFSIPPETPSGQVWRYGCGFPFQAAPRRAALLTSIEIQGTNNYGFLNGNDAVIFSSLDNADTFQAFALNRNEYQTSSDGVQQLLLKSPMLGGFVPQGALRRNGSAHPYAGSGFGIAYSHLFPWNAAENRFIWWDQARRDFVQTYRLSYDGVEFTCTAEQTYTADAQSPLYIANSPWRLVAPGLSMAIPDQDDLLLPVLAAGPDNTNAVGIARWTYQQGRWAPAAFTPVAFSLQEVSAAANIHEQCAWMEPTLTRGFNDTMLFCARTAPDSAAFSFVQLWQSCDNGITWQVIFRASGIRNDAPVSINMAADSTAFVVSNPYYPHFSAGPKTGRGREILSLWPFDASSGRLENPLLVLDSLREFGPPPACSNPDYNEVWMADHANGASLRLEDGAWHSLLAFRLVHTPLYYAFATPPAARSGCYLQEIKAQSLSRPSWNFGA